ncbi:hypothetical protein JTE90_024793 [Oedothorax gibbosus]|uniref:Uncharacterized protein n=1 Tax=Oedothorax gibbosus TaxID=931172 RepID=A0AAV6TZJ5_9ARAC|nr:hypothetical protein JTE90_024793 [Oedothorax gibbosus]
MKAPIACSYFSLNCLVRCRITVCVLDSNKLTTGLAEARQLALTSREKIIFPAEDEREKTLPVPIFTSSFGSLYFAYPPSIVFHTLFLFLWDIKVKRVNSYLIGTKCPDRLQD